MIMMMMMVMMMMIFKVIAQENTNKLVYEILVCETRDLSTQSF
jgi:hypothetical protein